MSEANIPIKDSDWIRKTFMIPSFAMSNQDEIRRELTEASYKFTDTTLGGNFAINPPPQFCSNADIPVPSRYAPSTGMGRYYSEALDDRGQTIHMRFGVPQFNSLTNFFFNFYSAQASSIANRGRSRSTFFYLGKAIGFVVSLPAMPIIWANQVVRFLVHKPASKFYYMKPAMPLYWSAVSTMVNAIGVNMGVIGRGMSVGEQTLRGVQNSSGPDPYQPGENAEWHRIKNDIWLEGGGIDIYAMANKAQRLARVQRVKVQEALEKANSWNDIKYNVHKAALENIEMPSKTRSLDEALLGYLNSSAGVVGSADKEMTYERVNSADGTIDQGSTFVDHLMAELEDGSQFITLRVDHTGSVSESFTNNVGESEIASKINGMSSSARSANFSMADGNLGDGVITGTITSFIQAAKDTVAGALEQVKLSGLAAFGGAAFVDIPQVWQSSVASLPRASYTIQLRSPYGNPISRFQNLVVPLSMILAGALPLSAGKQSYTSPFLCELYSKGRNQTRLGMIDSLTITRGTGNLGWTRNHEPLGIDITFSVVDLSTVMHMPITSNFGAVGAGLTGAASLAGAGVDAIAGAVGGQTNVQGAAEDMANLLSMTNFDDDNLFTDYLAVLGSISLADQIYPTNKLRLNRARRAADWEQWKSPAHHANWMAGTGIGQLVSALAHVTDRQ